MRLYHGTLTYFDNIDINKSSSSIDFGKAFYLTDKLDVAKDWAVRKTRSSNNKTIYVKEYEYTFSRDIHSIYFDANNHLEMTKWLGIISFYRNINIENIQKVKNGDDYDLIIGPIFDNGWIWSFKRYCNRLKTEESIKKLILETNMGEYQWAFKTNKSLQALQYIETHTFNVNTNTQNNTQNTTQNNTQNTEQNTTKNNSQNNMICSWR